MAQQSPAQVTPDALRQHARMSGLELTDARCEVLVPQLQTLRDELARLRSMEVDWQSIEPAHIFVPGEVE